MRRTMAEKEVRGKRSVVAVHTVAIHYYVTTKDDNCIGMITINDCSSSYIAEHAPPCLFKGKSRRHGVMKGTRAMNSSRHEIAGREIFKSLKG